MKNLLVTGAAGQIGYALLTRLASGETFGSDVKVNLNLVEVHQVVSRLEGSRMELEDCGFNTLGTVKNFSDMNEAEMAYEAGQIKLQTPIKVRVKNLAGDPEIHSQLKTTKDFHN